MFPNVPLYPGFVVSLPFGTMMLTVLACLLLVFSRFSSLVALCVDAEREQHACASPEREGVLGDDDFQPLCLRPDVCVVEPHAWQKQTT